MCLLQQAWEPNSIAKTSRVISAEIRLANPVSKGKWSSERTKAMSGATPFELRDCVAFRIDPLANRCASPIQGGAGALVSSDRRSVSEEGVSNVEEHAKL
jgi:hypothetical protein